MDSRQTLLLAEDIALQDLEQHRRLHRETSVNLQRECLIAIIIRARLLNTNTPDGGIELTTNEFVENMLVLMLEDTVNRDNQRSRTAV